MTILFSILISAICLFLLYLQDSRHRHDSRQWSEERIRLMDLIAYKERLPLPSLGVEAFKQQSAQPVTKQIRVELPLDRMRRETEERRMEQQAEVIG